jgi:hypothetical protein
MNPRVKKIWTGALRSGERRQGRGTLIRRTDDGNEECCLGVLCDLAVQEGVIKPPQFRSTVGAWGQIGFYGNRTATLPLAVQEWAGLDSADPFVRWEPQSLDRRRLSAINDMDIEFDRIADIIEEQL